MALLSCLGVYGLTPFSWIHYLFHALAYWLRSITTALSISPGVKVTATSTSCPRASPWASQRTDAAANESLPLLTLDPDTLTLSPPNTSLSAKFLVCFNCQSASMSLKVGENVIWVSNSLDLDETPSYSMPHPDPSCLHMELQLCLAGWGLMALEGTTLDISKLWGLFFTSSNCPKCKLICTSGNLDL